MQERVPKRRYFFSTHSAYRWRWWHLPSLRRFLKFWLKHKFNIETEITSGVLATYEFDVGAKILGGVSKRRSEYDLIIFIVDKTFWKHKQGFKGEGIYTGDWLVVKHTKSIDYAYLVTTTYRISHELLHWIADKFGWPRSQAAKVDQDNMRKTYIGWGRFSIIGHLRHNKPFNVTSGMPRYVSQGGTYTDPPSD